MREGISQVSVDDIATDLGMSKKTFYKYFRSKDELIAEIAQRLMADVRRNLESIFQKEASFPEKIDKFMTFIASKFASVGRPFFLDINKSYPELWNKIESFRRQRILENFERLLAEGKTQGYVRSDLNIQLFVLSYLAAIESVVIPSVLAEQSFSISEAIHGIVRIFFQGIMTPEANTKFEELQQKHPSF